MKKILRKLVRHLGFDVVPYSKDRTPVFPPDFDPESIEIIRAVRPYSMTTVEGLFALVQAVKYVAQEDIPGGIVECGVWQGGSMMAVALTLKRLGIEGIELFLFDTYEGMTRPSALDVNVTGERASEKFERRRTSANSSEWCACPVETVQQNLARTGYSMEMVRLIKGPVEDTIPGSAPQQIRLLRLDTDWYESTRHELQHLFSRLSAGGVLIIDDYGHWRGSRQATDEFLAQNHVNLLLNRVDYTQRVAVKR
ncbi:MAG: macrocin O-methyltransferase [Verrucomicrobia bacterium]|nr:macrocin O-methyltransferase [Verrucomicrobiota bacterium]